LLALTLVVSCSRSARPKDIYWRGELWDGTNRMVFALQDLGWKVENVATDGSVIIASKSAGKDEIENTVSAPRTPAETDSARHGTGPGAGEATGTAADTASDARGVYRIRIEFPEDGKGPIAVLTIGPNLAKRQERKLRKEILELTERFIWYGGELIQVREAESGAR